MTVGGDVEESLVWRGPFRSLPRDLSTASLRSLITAIAWLIGIGVVAVLPDVLGLTSLHGRQRLGMRVAFLIAATLTAGLFAVARASTRRLEVAFPALAAALFLIGPVLVNLAVVLVGANFGGVTVFFVELLLIAFLVLRRSWAIAVTVFTLALYVVALAALDKPPSPQLQFINVLAAAVATGVLMGAFTNRLDDTRRELAFMNAHLEERVATQVDELERTGRLRRFLSPQVAEVVTSEGAEALLAPHRAEIAVIFVDLRGFSAFANAATAARVMEVLHSYYDAVGRVLDAHGATIGGFDGDGVFAYLGDPVAHPDAASAAVRIAGEVARSLDDRTAEWSRSGQTIGYGIGLAFGQATLGSVGFAGRSDYTPVGPVVNLASRLCADAQHREIVIDDAMRTAARLAEAEVAPRRDVDLKGFGITRTYAVVH